MRHLSYMIGLIILTLGSSASGDGMTLVGQWVENDPNSLFADVWGQEITTGPHAGTYAYIGHFGGEAGVDIIDISDPSNPIRVSTFLGTGGANDLIDVKVVDDIGYFASDDPDNGGIFVVDVSNPAAPVQLARIDPSNGGFRHAHNAWIEDDYLYAVNNDGPEVRVFDVSDPANPSFVRTIEVWAPGQGQGQNLHWVHGVAVRNGRLYTANANIGRVGVYDIQNVGDLSIPVPLLGGFMVTSGLTHSAYPTEDGQFVVVAKEWIGTDVTIYDISDLGAPPNYHPVLASTIEVPTFESFAGHEPIVVGDLLYIAYFEAGIRVYNIADPYNPVLVGDYDTYDGPSGEEGECAGFTTDRIHPNWADFAPYPVACGAWGVYPFLGNDRILVSDFDGGLFIVSLD